MGWGRMVLAMKLSKRKQHIKKALAKSRAEEAVIERSASGFLVG